MPLGLAAESTSEPLTASGGFARLVSDPFSGVYEFRRELGARNSPRNEFEPEPRRSQDFELDEESDKDCQEATSIGKFCISVVLLTHFVRWPKISAIVLNYSINLINIFVTFGMTVILKRTHFVVMIINRV